MLTSIAPLPPQSSLQETLTAPRAPSYPSYPPSTQILLHTAQTILHNLRYQHEWENLQIHTVSPITHTSLARPIISGLPPKRSYIHPEEQKAILKAEHAMGKKIIARPEREWVLPTKVEEEMSIKQFAEVFDGICVVPPGESEEDEEMKGENEDADVGAEWKGEKRQKRLLLATLHEDSTAVYYIMHDGIVKPRQN